MLRAASIVSLLALVGCADTGDEGMYILNNTAPPSDSCLLTGATSQPFLAHGRIFSGSPIGYLFTPLIQSRQVLLEGETDMASRTIFLNGANVSLKVVSGSASIPGPQFSSLFAASLPPSGSVNVGFDIITPAQLAAIDPGLGANGSVEILADISVFGKLGGKEIESPVFSYPVTVCANCVVANLGVCPLPEAGPLGNSCNAFQDGTVGCCTDAGGNLVCPAIVNQM